MVHEEWDQPDHDDAPMAILLPGGRYSVQAPLLYWCAELLVQRGWRVVAVTWPPEMLSAADAGSHVEAEVDRVITEVGMTPDLIVAKSLGSYALPWAIRHDVRGVWLTPVLTDAAVRDALALADSRHLAVGGSLDRMWAPAATLATDALMLTIDGTDHGILVPHDWYGSMRIQRDLMADIESHSARVDPRRDVVVETHDR